MGYMKAQGFEAFINVHIVLNRGLIYFRGE